MELSAKLQVPDGASVRIINAPSGLDLGLPSGTGILEAILFFAQDSKSLRTRGEPAFDAARRDKLVWIAYPKAGQLGTDLNRDKVWALLKDKGIRPVRQVSINDTWSALRFRPEGKASGHN